MNDDKKDVLEYVPADRRDFLKKLLAGAAFAAPVIATFSIDALTADSAYAQTANTIITANLTANQCATDVGYVGPRLFLAHVTGGLNPPPPPAPPPHPPDVPPVTYRINGEVSFTLQFADGVSVPAEPGILDGTVVSIGGEIHMVQGVTLTGAQIMVGPGPAVVLTLSGITHYTNTVGGPGPGPGLGPVCDLDELADVMAAGGATVQITGTYNGSPFTANGPIIAAPYSNPV